MIIDGGNAHFNDTRRREAALRDQGIHFVGMGVSGGEEGALNGPSIMPGGSAESYESPRPDARGHRREGRRRALRDPRRTGRRRPLREDGPQRHRVRRHAADRRGVRPAPARGSSAGADRRHLPHAGTPAASTPTSSRSPPRCSRTTTRRRAAPSSTSCLTRPSRRAPAGGPCRSRSTWACPSTASREAIFARGAVRSRRPARRGQGPGRPVPRPHGSGPGAFADKVEQALYASKIVAYAQGWNMIVAGAESTAGTSTSGRWRHLARRLHHPGRVPRPDPRRVRRQPAAADPARRPRLRQGGHRRAGRLARGGGDRGQRRIPVPGFSAALAYYDALAPSGCPPRSSRACATSSARTPTVAPTPRAASTPCGPRTARKSTGKPARPPRHRQGAAQVRGTPHPFGLMSLIIPNGCAVTHQRPRSRRPGDRMLFRPNAGGNHIQ